MWRSFAARSSTPIGTFAELDEECGEEESIHFANSAIGCVHATIGRVHARWGVGGNIFLRTLDLVDECDYNVMVVLGTPLFPNRWGAHKDGVDPIMITQAYACFW